MTLLFTWMKQVKPKDRICPRRSNGYYKNEFSTYWRDGGVLQDIDRVNNTSAGRLNQAGPMDAARPERVEAGLTDQMRLQATISKCLND